MPGCGEQSRSVSKEVLFACLGRESVPWEASPTQEGYRGPSGAGVRFLCPSKQGVTRCCSWELPKRAGTWDGPCPSRFSWCRCPFRAIWKSKWQTSFIKIPRVMEQRFIYESLCGLSCFSHGAAGLAVGRRGLSGPPWLPFCVASHTALPGQGAGRALRAPAEPWPLASRSETASWQRLLASGWRHPFRPKEAVTSREGLCQKVKIWLKATCLGARLRRRYGAFFVGFFCVLHGCFQRFLPTRPAGRSAARRC